MFDIELAPEALEDLEWFRKHEQVQIDNEMEVQLRHQPNVRTRKRKPLQAGHLAEWELRIDDFRVFYDVDPDASLVRVVRIGYKERNRLFLREQEYLS